MTTDWDMSEYTTIPWCGIHKFSRQHWKMRSDGTQVFVFFHHGGVSIPVNKPKGWYCGFEGTDPPDWCGPFKTRALARLTAELLP